MESGGVQKKYAKLYMFDHNCIIISQNEMVDINALFKPGFMFNSQLASSTGIKMHEVMSADRQTLSFSVYRNNEDFQGPMAASISITMTKSVVDTHDLVDPKTDYHELQSGKDWEKWAQWMVVNVDHGEYYWDHARVPFYC